MKLSAGYLNLAIRLQEAADQDLSAGDVQARLRDAINDAFHGSGTWAYYIDHFGDSNSGDVIYSCGGDSRRAGYEISGGNGTAAVCTIDTDNSENVVPRTMWEPEADEADHYAQMEESMKTAKLYTALPLYERFISKSERAAMDSSDFAGKGKSFPVKTQADVMAAFHSLGRAGSDNYSTAVIRANIIKIAKRKGFKLPKSAQEKDAKEAAKPAATASLKLVDSSPCFLEDVPAIALREGRTTYPIKIISPGTGTTAHYPAKVLEEAAKAGKFPAGTLMFWNHPTASEEAARPEGDLDKLAAITTKPGFWDPNGARGPGVYAESKPMADYAQKVEERAPHIGLSIRAGGSGTGRLVEGKPELQSIDYVESVDYVTKAGRGGLALAEAARDAGILPAEAGQEVSMTEAEVQKLVESAVKSAVAEATKGNVSLQERALRGDAREEATALLESVSLPEAAKQRVVRSITSGFIPAKDGELDRDKLKLMVEAAVKEEGTYLGAILGNGARPIGMGAAVPIDPKEATEQAEKSRKAAKRQLKEAAAIFEDLGMPKEAAEFAAKGRVA